MIELTHAHLLEAAAAGGASALTEVTALGPAAGPHASIAPARYTTKSGEATYAYETRSVDGAPLQSVLVDSRGSLSNRIEEALKLAIDEGHPVLSNMPGAQVSYTLDGAERVFSDIELPHRAFDAHIRAAQINGEAVTQNEIYKAARNATPSDAWNLFQLSPITVAFGGWDATRKTRQGRYASLLSGEIIGILADQNSETPRPARHSGARIDPVAASVKLEQANLNALIDQQADELSENFLKKNRVDKKGTASGSVLGFGAIPPGVDDLAGIATSQIIRSYVLSLAGIRRLRFGQGIEGDQSIRALISALLLNGMARANSELYLRANCHLIEIEAPTMLLDQRMGNHEKLLPLTISQADALLEEAYQHAHRVAGVDWHGQVFAVVGNPAVLAGADDTLEDPK